MAPRSNDARQRLIDTATKLFAEQGVEAVSLREIVRAAGVKHATAVQYHFGDREGLVESVLRERDVAVDLRRDTMLDHARTARGIDSRLLAEMLVRPLAAELNDEGGRLYLRIYAEMIVRSKHTMTNDGTSMWRWREYTRQHLPDSPDELHPRFTALTYAAVTLAQRAITPPHADDRLFVSRLIDLVAAMLAAPVSDETHELLTQRGEPGNTSSSGGGA